MGSTLKNDVEEMFKEFGVTIKHNMKTNEFVLPEKIDFFTHNSIPYHEWDDETKIKQICEYIRKDNHFRIANCEFFLPTLELKELDRRTIIGFFIYFHFYMNNKNNDFEVVVYPVSEDFFINLRNNGDFVKCFSNKTQTKAIFLKHNQLYLEFEKEAKTLIKDKIIELGINERINVDLPKLIMKFLDEK